MTTTNQIKELAMLDGFEVENRGQLASFFWKNKGCHNAPDYLTSYDAIIPLVQKLVKDNFNLQAALSAELRILSGNKSGLWTAELLSLTPQQLSEALLRATGRWKE